MAAVLTYSSDLRVVHTSGNEEDPTNPFGRVVVTILGDGEVSVTQSRHGERREWSGRTTRATIDAVLELLNAAFFPRVADHAIPPGSTRDIQVVSGGREYQTPPIAYHAPKTMPAYQLLFQLMDELVTAVTDQAVKVTMTQRADLLAADET
jgi:hypothetical protein